MMDRIVLNIPVYILLIHQKRDVYWLLFNPSFAWTVWTMYWILVIIFVYILLLIETFWVLQQIFPVLKQINPNIV